LRWDGMKAGATVGRTSVSATHYQVRIVEDLATECCDQEVRGKGTWNLEVVGLLYLIGKAKPLKGVPGDVSVVGI
jgi:hypothetical protein